MRSARSASAASAKEAMLSEMDVEIQDDVPKEWVPGEHILHGGSISEGEDEPHDNDDDDNIHDDDRLAPTTCNALQLSPLRNASISQARPRAMPSTSASYPSLPTPSKLPLSQATDLLRALLAESLIEFREESRSQMRGLHLDLLRVGRGMRKEVKEVVGEVLGDMQVECKCKAELETLKEENERLREEVRRLRMGMGI
jgi:protein NEDD1